MPWFRFYGNVLRSPKIYGLSDKEYRYWTLCLCLANEGNPRGVLPNIKDIAFHFRLSIPRAQSVIDRLIAAELLDQVGVQLMPHDWREWQFQSDNVTERVDRHRDGKRGIKAMSVVEPQTLHVTTNATLPETFPEADLEADPEADLEAEPEAEPEQNRNGHAPRSRGTCLSEQQVTEFNRWWAIIPAHQHVDRKAAEEQWQQINPRGDLTDAIMAGTTAQLGGRRWTEQGHRFMPSPHRILRDHRWEDGVAPIHTPEDIGSGGGYRNRKCTQEEIAADLKRHLRAVRNEPHGSGPIYEGHMSVVSNTMTESKSMSATIASTRSLNATGQSDGSVLPPHTR